MPQEAQEFLMTASLLRISGALKSLYVISPVAVWGLCWCSSGMFRHCLLGGEDHGRPKVHERLLCLTSFTNYITRICEIG